MPPRDSFPGVGIYAIYYTGDFPAYRPISKKNRGGRFELPIYAGQAAGARKGDWVLNPEPSFILFDRLREHARSIEQTTNLRLSDFHYRFMVVDDIWIPLGGAVMIDTFAPVWNKLIGGFGIHTPSGNRHKMTSAWDTLHPGRTFVIEVKLLPNPNDPQLLIKEMQQHLALQNRRQAELPTIETGEE